MRALLTVQIPPTNDTLDRQTPTIEAIMPRRRNLFGTSVMGNPNGSNAPHSSHRGAIFTGPNLMHTIGNLWWREVTDGADRAWIEDVRVAV